MKAVVNGVELEGTPAELAEYIHQAEATKTVASFVQAKRPDPLPSPKTPEVPDWLDDLVSSLTPLQRETFYAIPGPKSRGVNLAALAEKLGANPSAVQQRCNLLVQFDLVTRVRRGVYRRVG